MSYILRSLRQPYINKLYFRNNRANTQYYIETALLRSGSNVVAMFPIQ